MKILSRSFTLVLGLMFSFGLSLSAQTSGPTAACPGTLTNFSISSADRITWTLVNQTTGATNGAAGSIVRTNGTAITWGTPTSSANNVRVNFFTPGRHVLSWTRFSRNIFGSLRTLDSGSFIVDVLLTTPQIVFLGTFGDCAGVTLGIGNPQVTATYTWSTGATGTTVNIPITQNSISVTATGCSQTTSASGGIPPFFDIIIQPVLGPVCAGDFLELTAVSTQCVPSGNWTWNLPFGTVVFSQNDTGSSSTIFIQVPNTGGSSLFVSVSATNFNGNNDWDSEIINIITDFECALRGGNDAPNDEAGVEADVQPETGKESNGVKPLQEGGNTTTTALYPNPTSDYFSVGNATTLERIEIRTLDGRQVLSLDAQAVGDQQGTVDVSRLPAGMYLVSRVEMGGTVTTEKLQVLR